MLTITACRFKRTKKSEYEDGIMINGDALIVDMHANPVKAPIWDYRLLSDQFVMTYNPSAH